MPPPWPPKSNSGTLSSIVESNSLLSKAYELRVYRAATFGASCLSERAMSCCSLTGTQS